MKELDEFLIAVELTANMKDGTKTEGVVWKHCADSVLRFFLKDGTQLLGIDTICSGFILVPTDALVLLKVHCKEER